jgi:hypothetical protein
MIDVVEFASLVWQRVEKYLRLGGVEATERKEARPTSEMREGGLTPGKPRFVHRVPEILQGLRRRATSRPSRTALDRSGLEVGFLQATQVQPDLSSASLCCRFS